VIPERRAFSGERWLMASTPPFQTRLLRVAHLCHSLFTGVSWEGAASGGGENKQSLTWGRRTEEGEEIDQEVGEFDGARSMGNSTLGILVHDERVGRQGLGAIRALYLQAHSPWSRRWLSFTMSMWLFSSTILDAISPARTSQEGV